MISEYFEFPPIFSPDKFIKFEYSKNFKKFYDQKKPLLQINKNNIKKYKIAFLDRNEYNWMTYVKLK